MARNNGSSGKPSPRAEDGKRTAHILRMVKDNPNIPVGNVVRDVDGRDVSRLVNELIADGKIDRTDDGRLR